jgi:uncharacterized protein DUF4349
MTLVLAAACGGGDSTDRGTDESGIQGGAPLGDGDSVSDAGGDDGGSDPNLPTTAERKITLSATIQLRVDDIPAAVQTIEDIAADRGGYVSDSEVSAGPSEENDRGVSTMRIRVPAASYTSVIRELRGLATTVDSEGSQATEVTDEYTDLQARLRNLQATEARYLELLARAETIDEILTVQDRVNGVRLEIEQVQGRLNVLNDLTDFATISIDLRLPPLVATSGESEGWAQQAVETSWEATRLALQVFGTIAIATAFLLPWLLVPALVVAGSWRLFGRRISATVERISRL